MSEVDYPVFKKHLNGQLCTLCNEVYILKKQSHFIQHIQTKKHRQKLQRAAGLKKMSNEDGPFLSDGGIDVANQFFQLSTRSHTTNSSPSLDEGNTKILSDKVQFEVPDSKVSGPPSQDPSFKTKSSELGGALSSDQFNMNTASENASFKKEVEMLIQQICKLEGALGVRETEILQLRATNITLEGDAGRLKGELSGLNVVKSLLKEKEEEIKKLNAKLIQANTESPIDPHKMCKTLQFQLKVRLEEKDKQMVEWKTIADNLIKNNTNFEEFKKQMRRISAQSSAIPSRDQIMSCSQYEYIPFIQTAEYHSDIEMDATKDQKLANQQTNLPQQLASRNQLFGFENVGNTCYAGAALQCIQIVSHYLQGSLLFAKSPHKPKLKKFYETIFDFKDVWAQNDSCEALFQLISNQSWKSNLEFMLTTHTECGQCQNKTSNGQLQNCINLECVEESLELCLASFQKDEILKEDTSYDCSQCLKRTEATISTQISQTNDIIMICLKRYFYQGGLIQKNNKLVTAPFQIIINLQRYEVCAFVIHCDSQVAEQGHYKAYANFDNEWCEFDDEKMRTIKPIQLKKLASQGYYYVYRRVRDSTDSFTQLVDWPDQLCLQNLKCPLCSSDFISLMAKHQHYENCNGLKQQYFDIRSQLLAFIDESTEIDAKIQIQTTLEFEGSNLGFVTSAAKDCGQQLSLKLGRYFEPILKLQQELHNSDYFKQISAELLAGPVADADGNAVYAQNSTRDKLIRILGKHKSRKSTSALEMEIVTKMKKEIGIALSIDERRCLEAEDIKYFLKQYEKDMLQIKDYLNNFKGMRLSDPFTKVNGIFCDGLILPRLQQIFTTYRDFESSIHLAGIQVQKVSPAQKEGLVYVRLQDSANEFTIELILKLDALIQNCRKQLKINNETQEVIDNCFVRQIDCTQDIKGFFVSFDVKNDIKQLSELIQMDTTHDYSTFESLFTLLKKVNYGTEETPLVLKQTRFKIYNKLLHFLESEQGKKKVSMNLKALLSCSSQFYQKLKECFDFGSSRLEFSHYLYSAEELSINVMQCQRQIDNALDQVNKLPQLRYQVPFDKFFDSFWSSSKPVFIFQNDSWTVVYAKHSKSTYVGQTVKITSKRFTNADKLNVIKRFAIPGKWCTVLDTTFSKVYKVMKKGKKVMQIPIQSLNTFHQKSYEFPFDQSMFKYNLSDEELDKISLVLESGELFQFIHNSLCTVGANKRDIKKREKEEKKEDHHEMKQRLPVSVEEKNEGKKGRCVYIIGNTACRYVFKSKQGGREKLVIVYACQTHQSEFLFKDMAGFYLEY